MVDCKFKDQLKKYECTVCGCIFKTPKKSADVYERKQGMKRHIIARHMKIKKWRCLSENCKKTFSRHTEFKLHASSQHYKNEKYGREAFKCTQCNKEFLRSGNLREHERTHGERKTMICDKCGRAFTHKSTLSNHKNKRFIVIKRIC